jgi:8-oxo-dGTP pyrophosphatase MutT (NUDIX family)
VDRFIDQVSNRMQRPLPGLPAQLRMVGRVVTMPTTVPADAKSSAVLCLLFRDNNQWHILLMKRMGDKGPHSGQVSFPGGRHEPTDADYTATALREANEEVGIAPEAVRLLGALTPLYIPVSNYNVYPFLGWVPERPNYLLSPTEVEYVLELPLSVLFHEERKTIAHIKSPAFPDAVRKVNAYQMNDGTTIWGATAMILAEIEELVNKQ